MTIASFVYISLEKMCWKKCKSICERWRRKAAGQRHSRKCQFKHLIHTSVYSQLITMFFFWSNNNVFLLWFLWLWNKFTFLSGMGLMLGEITKIIYMLPIYILKQTCFYAFKFMYLYQNMSICIDIHIRR